MARASATWDVQSLGEKRFSIGLEGNAQAPIECVWTALTDYEHHAEWMPNLDQSELLKREGTAAEVRQKGRVRVWIWSFPITVIQEISESAPTHLQFHSSRGTFREMTGEWRLQAHNQATHVEAHFEVQARRYIPEWAVRFVTKRYLLPMFDALCDHSANLSQAAAPAN